jgi:hypothetical protein
LPVRQPAGAFGSPIVSTQVKKVHPAATCSDLTVVRAHAASS